MQISVVIPTYNRAHLVNRAIDSVLRQTLPPEEIIVVDDGSSDDTVAKLRIRYGNSISVLQVDTNQGVSPARNLAVNQSSGDWIAFLDSDDEWLPEKLKRQTELMATSAYELCHTDEIWIRNNVRVNPMKKHTKEGGDIFERCVQMCVVSPSSVVVRKAAFLRAGGFDETLPACEDYDLWLKLSARSPVRYIDEPLLIKYGGHNDQLSRKHWGMDRFRIYSLNNLLAGGTLSDTQYAIARTELLKKLGILKKGAEKHNNTELLSYCDDLLCIHGKY